MRGISIITVVRNAQSTIERTLRSVDMQSARQLIEHIIVDGLSTDQTMQIVLAHESPEGLRRQSVSEADNGIYDAMNKGLNMASQDYVWFINAGDELYDADTAKHILDIIDSEDADVVYGDTLIVGDDGKPIGQRRLSPPEALTWRDFKRGMLVSHQSFVARRSLCPQYDTRYHFSADFDWCVRILQSAKVVCNSQQTLSRFLDGGMTKHNIARSLRERFAIMRTHYGLLSTVAHHIPIAIRFFIFWLRKGWF